MRMVFMGNNNLMPAIIEDKTVQSKRDSAIGLEIADWKCLQIQTINSFITQISYFIFILTNGSFIYKLKSYFLIFILLFFLTKLKKLHWINQKNQFNSCLFLSIYIFLLLTVENLNLKKKFNFVEICKLINIYFF